MEYSQHTEKITCQENKAFLYMTNTQDRMLQDENNKCKHYFAYRETPLITFKEPDVA